MLKKYHTTKDNIERRTVKKLMLTKDNIGQIKKIINYNIKWRN
jgi:hypothetical protein